jgi:hypothetical protein
MWGLTEVHQLMHFRQLFCYIWAVSYTFYVIICCRFTLIWLRYQHKSASFVPF